MIVLTFYVSELVLQLVDFVNKLLDLVLVVCALGGCEIVDVLGSSGVLGLLFAEDWCSG